MTDKLVRYESENIGERIYTIRGQKVIMDFDLAAIYNVTTKRLNEQVKRNEKRFPSDFIFQLTLREWDDLKAQIMILKGLTNLVAICDRFTKTPRSSFYAFCFYRARRSDGSKHFAKSAGSPDECFCGAGVCQDARTAG